VVGTGGSAADGAADGAAAEQPGSAAATHRDAAAMTDSFAGIRRGRPIP
jgi:hypothetical protein